MSRSFRLLCKPKHINLVEALLKAEGYDFMPEAFSPWCRILTHEPKPLGASLAAFFGLLYIQDRSSMLPPLALVDTAPCEGKAVLDMCASPGSKTGFLAQLLGNTGFVLGNEPSKPRLATLRANMQSLSLLQVSTCSYAGELLPLMPESWDYIQLDPPCSGWGTVEKNPKVLTLWQGDKVKPLITIQQKLLRKAYELLRPGGQVVYSTCTTNIQENEDQVRFALEEVGFELVPLAPFNGFVWQDPLTELAENTLRVDGEQSKAQGFYIAKFRKPQLNTTACAHEPISFEGLAPSLLASPCTDIELLPPGKIVLFGETARFIPQAAFTALSSQLQWQASALGKFSGDNIRLAPRCRLLLTDDAQRAQSEGLILENIADIRALLQGQSRQTGLEGRETGLYYSTQGELLPLGRITLKKGRALWSAK